MVLPNCGHSLCSSSFHDWYCQYCLLVKFFDFIITIRGGNLGWSNGSAPLARKMGQEGLIFLGLSKKDQNGLSRKIGRDDPVALFKKNNDFFLIFLLIFNYFW